MRRKWRKAKPKQKKRFLANHLIKSQEVFLINEQGENIGKIATDKALEIAKDLGLDLVEVNPKANPPVAKIIDLGQLKYEQEKKAQKQKAQQKKIETKALRLSIRISKHDFDFRLKQAIEFLNKGHKLKLELIIRGRERQHPQKAVEIIKKFVNELSNNENLNIVEEQSLTKQGGRFIIILINKK